MEEEIDLEEVQLKVLTAKKQQLFSSIQRIFDVSKNVGSESSRATFLKKVGTVEVLFKEFVTTLEKCCSLELRINPGAKVSFSEMATVEEMVGYIKYKDGELAKPPPPAPAPNINKFYIWSNKNKFMNERMLIAEDSESSDDSSTDEEEVHQRVPGRRRRVKPLPSKLTRKKNAKHLPVYLE
ncbi:hypothetical protein M8J75_007319, partial [Diaphorina citri]